MPDLNLDDAAAGIASDLGFGSEESTDFVEETTDEAPVETPVEAPVEADPYREPPKSWKKEWHEKWNTVAPDVREIFYTREKQMLDGLDQYKSGYEIGNKLSPVFDQHRDFLKSQGVDEVQAVQYLLSAQQRLMTGTPEQKREMILNLARGVGVELTPAQEAAAAQSPEITAVLEKVQGIESFVQRQQEAAHKQERQKIVSVVDSFWSDPKNEHVDTVSKEMTVIINGLRESGVQPEQINLDEVYQQAVWANPVSRAKELEKETTSRLEAAKAKAKEEAEAATKAKAVNVRTRASNKAPTEPLGSWDDTMKETLARVKAGAL